MREPMDWSSLALDVDTSAGPTYGTVWINAPIMDPEVHDGLDDFADYEAIIPGGYDPSNTYSAWYGEGDDGYAVVAVYETPRSVMGDVVVYFYEIDAALDYMGAYTFRLHGRGLPAMEPLYDDPEVAVASAARKLGLW